MDSRLQSSGSSKSSESPLLHPLLSAHITLEVLYPFGGGGGADLGRGNCRIRNFYYLHISTRLSHFLQVFFHLCRKGESQQPRPGDRGGGGGRGCHTANLLENMAVDALVSHFSEIKHFLKNTVQL